MVGCGFSSLTHTKAPALQAEAPLNRLELAGCEATLGHSSAPAAFPREPTHKGPLAYILFNPSRVASPSQGVRMVTKL